MKNKVFNIPLSCSFAQTLAKNFVEEYKDNPLGLADALFILPNRRACITLREAFLRAKGLKPFILPKMMPIGDVEEDELWLSGAVDTSVLESIKPAISKTERMMLFTKIIASRPHEFGISNISLSQACYLAQELASFMDTVNFNGLSFDGLQKLVPDEYSAHWQETLKFLEIITKFWPEILAEKGVEDSSTHKKELLKIQTEIWKKQSSSRIVLAGLTATYPYMKEMVKEVLPLPQASLILCGLDKSLEDEDWESIEPTHPQFELKDLLDYLQISRFEVRDYVKTLDTNKELLITEIMRPAKTTHKWREIGKIDKRCLEDIETINCADIRQEALSIALTMREVLETPEKTAALVTFDRNLARRVANELLRWDIKVDDSAGKPLSLTAVGQFVRLLVKVITDDFSAVSLLSFIKHPFCNIERKLIRDWEMSVRNGLEAIDLGLKEKLCNLSALFLKPKAPFKEFLEEHLKALSDFALAKDLWKGEEGEACSAFFAEMLQYADVLGEIEAQQYSSLLEALMMGIMVRPRFGLHPRLKILGPIEARLSMFDVVVLGEVNEGIWPKTLKADPWMSHLMKKDFGMPDSEKSVGVTAFDFSYLLTAPQVYLARAERVQGTPMVKSRFWMRLETVAKASKIELFENVLYSNIAKNMDRVKDFKKINPPAPKPPLHARPKELSASSVENLMRDPYIIFARQILRLKPLEDLEKELEIKDYGNIVHAVLEEFNNKYPATLPTNAKEELLSIGNRHLAEISVETKVFWQQSFEKTVDWILDIEKPYRKKIEEVKSEIEGFFELKNGFKIKAKADRIDILKNGKVNIIDYKTGLARSKKEVATGYAPQLPIEGLIASRGGFGIEAREVEALEYWRLGKSEPIVINEDIKDILSDTLNRIEQLIELFGKEETPYLSQPNPKNAPKYSDYEHLARIKEWAVIDEEGADD